MYAHIDRIKDLVESEGIKFTTFRPPKTFEQLLIEEPFDTKKHGVHYGYGWPTSVIRWCTKHLKTNASKEYIEGLKETYGDVVLCTGIAADERERLERDWNGSHRHPLAEWGMTEADCLQYCKSKGYDWNGLYDTFRRVSCWCCPLAPMGELYKLYENYPELWAKLQEWEDIMERIPGNEHRQKFKGDHTIRDLTERFARVSKAKRDQTNLEKYGWEVHVLHRI